MPQPLIASLHQGSVAHSLAPQGLSTSTGDLPVSEEKSTRASHAKPTKPRQSSKAPNMTTKAPPRPPNTSTVAVELRKLAAAETPKATGQTMTPRLPNQTPRVSSKPSNELTQMPQAPAETSHRSQKPLKTMETVSASVEPPTKVPKGSSKPSAPAPTRSPIFPAIPQSEPTPNLPQSEPTPNPKESHAEITPEDHPWKVVYKDDETGEGPIVELGHTVMMWYFCRIKDTGVVYQQSTTADGPPVEFLSTFPSHSPLITSTPGEFDSG